MNRKQYINALTYCCKLETAGAIAGEVAMLLRENPQEKRKLDIFRRLEASNKILCVRSLQHENMASLVVETSYYRNGYKLGQKLGEGSWEIFLDHFEATVHPETFAVYLLDDEGNEREHEYKGVDVALLRHLVRHEQSLAKFVQHERKGDSSTSTCAMEELLDGELCAGLIGPEEPVGW